MRTTQANTIDISNKYASYIILRNTLNINWSVLSKFLQGVPSLSHLIDKC